MSNYGETLARSVDRRLAAAPASQTTLKAIPLASRYDGQLAIVEADQTQWQFVLASTASASATCLVPTDGLGGRWLALIVPGTGTAAAAPAANGAAISALSSSVDGQLVVDASTGWLWRYSLASTAADTTGNLVLAATGIGAGAWLREALAVDLKLAIGFGTADAATLFTVPVGFKLRINRALWEITTSFTGGTTPAVGVSSTNANYNTKGDILGGASGDLTATLVSTGSPYKGGTLGAKFGTNGVVVLVAGDTLRYDRIANAFTAGAGFVHAECQVIT